MNLLPDFTISGHKISLQDPYTIDGRLPRKFEYNYNPVDQTYTVNVILDNYSHFQFSLLYMLVCPWTGNTPEIFIDENGVEIRNYPTNVSEWFYRINLQSLQHVEFENNYLGRLVAQNRASAYELVNRSATTNLAETEVTSDSDSAIITSASISDSTRPNRNRRVLTAEGLSSYSEQVAAHLREEMNTLSEINQRLTEQTETVSISSIIDSVSAINATNGVTRVSIENYKSYIHSYDYKPEYIKHYMPGEDPNTTLLLGAEIEVGGSYNLPWNPTEVKNTHVKRCIQIMNGSDSDDEDLIYSTYDSTVQIELDTMPCSLAFHKEKMNYKKLFKYLDKEGYKGHDCSTAGLHIHANREYLGKTKLLQQLTISKILYILEKFNDEICVIARRGNDYSRFMGAGKQEDTVIDLYKKYDNSKHVALNLKHKDTIEFRCFQSTLKYETFILTLEFVNKIIDFAKAINIEEIETIKWGHLLKTFSDELRDYYYKRKALEEKKAKEAKLNNMNSNLGNFVQGCSSSESVGGYYYTPSDLEILSLFGAFDVNNSTGSISLSASGTIETVSSFEIERNELKKEIKRTKKKINNSRNGLEKIRLQRELNEMQKELKQVEKRIRQEARAAS